MHCSPPGFPSSETVQYATVHLYADGPSDPSSSIIVIRGDLPGDLATLISPACSSSIRARAFASSPMPASSSISFGNVTMARLVTRLR